MKQLDLQSIRYRVIAHPPNKSPIDITPLCQDITHKEDSERFASVLEVMLKNIKERDYGWIHSSVKPMTTLKFEANDGAGWKNIMIGLVMTWTTHAEDHRITLVAYDMLHRAMQSESYFYFEKNVNAKTRLETVSKESGLKIDIKSNKLGVALPEADYTSSVASTVESILEEANKLNNAKHIVRADTKNIGAEIVEVGKNENVYEITDWSIGQSSHEIDVEDLVTVVKIYGNKEGKGKPPLKATHKQNTEYGEVIKIISTSSDKQSDADKEAKEILKERSKPKEKVHITTADIPFLKKGDKLQVATGTYGSYRNGKQMPKAGIVKSLQRSVSDRTMRIVIEA